MKRAHLSRLVFVGLIVLSGCSGFFGIGSDDGSRETEMVTPFNVPDVPHFESPPGVRDERLAAPERLLDQHWALLSDNAYSAQRRHVERKNESTSVRTVVTVQHANDSRYRATVVSTRTLADRDEYWFDGSQGYLATTIDNETQYTRPLTARGSAPLAEDLLYFGTPPYRSGVVSQRGLYRYITAAGGSSLKVTKPDNRLATRYHLSIQLSNHSNLGIDERFESIRNGSFTAVVDARGLIRSYRLTYNGVVNGQVVNVTETVSYELDPKTTVTPPAWTDNVTVNP